MNTNKPIVKYLPGPMDYIQEGESASVYAVDHYSLGSQPVLTSRVLSVQQDGTFETRNTIYSPEKGVEC